MNESDDLTGALKRAVDEVKGPQPPEASVAQSVDRASRLATTIVSRRRRIVAVMAASTVAATMLMGIALWAEHAAEEGKPSALTTANPAAYAQVDFDGDGSEAVAVNQLRIRMKEANNGVEPFAAYANEAFVPRDIQSSGGTGMPGAPPGFNYERAPGTVGQGTGLGTGTTAERREAQLEEMKRIIREQDSAARARNSEPTFKNKVLK